MVKPKLISLDDAIKAHKALREACGLGPEVFPVRAFVGMISDEVELLSRQGKSNEQIAEIIRRNSSIDITAEEIAENFAPAEKRLTEFH